MNQNHNNKIKLVSLSFSDVRFRKLKNIKINFADRLTLIAGHNGIGKSTILGLITNTFGITTDSPRSYFEEMFYTNIEKIVYLALDEVDEVQKNSSKAPVITALVKGSEVKKRCALTRREKYKRARVVPRTIPDQHNSSASQIVKPDGKVPLPTIYLGTKRLSSIGEAGENDVTSTTLTNMHNEDVLLIKDFVSSVMLNTDITTHVTQQKIAKVRKQTIQPGYKDFNAMAVSLGQDSLGSIATAIASFNRLKRELAHEYCGGLLVIDELDIGLHPYAIQKLAEQLKHYARQLDLQVVATSHSPILVENIHPDGDGSPNSPDSVIYLIDTKTPRLADDQSLKGILNDMALRFPFTDEEKQTLCIYFEDNEAKQFFNALIAPQKRTAIGKKYGLRIKLIPLGVGGTNLIKFPDVDPIFKNRVLIVDGDTCFPRGKAAKGNIIKLPCTPEKKRSPENTIRAFLYAMKENIDGPFHDAMLTLPHQNSTSDLITKTFFSGSQNSVDLKREQSKKWWIENWEMLSKWKILNAWKCFYSNEVDCFVEDFESAINTVAQKIQTSSC